ncbi:MAG: DUF2993 domain-containing protein [Spirulinaceae cyanobacterium SM2_1_0]|nr:DUF2993 domain-containing protein [Spirulinaceae cyanobacterium SM2_1_0]
MLLLNSNNLGEQALNKLATLALQSHFESAQNLDVQVKTDPNLLAQGRLASLTLDGTGLVLSGQTRLRALQLHLQSIAVSPFKALVGQIELTEPTQGSACLVLGEADCARALAAGQGRPSLHCHCRADGTLTLRLEPRRASAAVEIVLRPQLSPAGDRVVCEVIAASSSPPTNLLAHLERLLNLEAFVLPGLSLKPLQLRVETGRIVIQAAARLTHFPNSKAA